ncbi:MAG: hypothetical protein LBD50_04025 [Rickettsiales bacterium]|jgi:hypothetical protein|nr:hypothetical protein [Rickettsiales bacterium]
MTRSAIQVRNAEPLIPVAKTINGLDFNLVRAAENSAGVNQYRMAVKLEAEADDIVTAMTAQGRYAAKIQKGDQFFVAMVDNADEFAKLKPYALSPMPKSGISSILENAKNAYKAPIGEINGHGVFLEPLPTVNGGTTPIGNISGRSVVVVNVNGRKVPFYVSSGKAGKDALGIPSGQWYPLVGIGDQGGWFNKMPDMLNNSVPKLDNIVEMLKQKFPGGALRQAAMSGDDIPYLSPEAYNVINSEFKKGVVQKLLPGNIQGVGNMRPEDEPLYNANIELLENLFKNM